MGETAIGEIYSHVVDLPARCEEHEVAGGEIASADRFAGVRLFAGRPRQLDSELVTKERDDKAGAIRSGWKVATQTVGRGAPGLHCREKLHLESAHRCSIDGSQRGRGASCARTACGNEQDHGHYPQSRTIVRRTVDGCVNKPRGPEGATVQQRTVAEIPSMSSNHLHPGYYIRCDEIDTRLSDHGYDRVCRRLCRWLYVPDTVCAARSWFDCDNGALTGAVA
jgi:hypothetical protein